MGGIDIVSCLQKGTDFSSYYINDIDALSPYCISILSDILTDQKLVIREIPRYRKASVESFHKLLMFSTTDLNQISSDLTKLVDIQLNINIDCSSEEIYQILNQRIQYLGWQIKNGELLRNISEVAFETVSIAIKILAWTYRCCRSSGEDVMTAKHLNQALHLMKDDKS